MFPLKGCASPDCSETALALLFTCELMAPTTSTCSMNIFAQWFGNFWILFQAQFSIFEAVRRKTTEGTTLIIWLSGATGSGKTSTSAILAQVGCSVVREEVPPKLFQAFLSDPTKYCEELQETLMRSRYSQFQLVRDERYVIFDRSVEEDLEVFCRMHHETGYLRDDAMARLETLAAELKADLPTPDLIIYLKVNEVLLSQRMAEIGHPKLIVDSLSAQLKLYSKWVSCLKGNVLVVDNANCRPQALKTVLAGLQC